MDIFLPYAHYIIYIISANYFAAWKEINPKVGERRFYSSL